MINTFIFLITIAGFGKSDIVQVAPNKFISIEQENRIVLCGEYEPRARESDDILRKMNLLNSYRQQNLLHSRKQALQDRFLSEEALSNEEAAELVDDIEAIDNKIYHTDEAIADSREAK